MSLTQAARRCSVSRASVVRWVREALQKNAEAIPAMMVPEAARPVAERVM
jgi:predicted DNA-binding protein (UPF0251 family)